MKSIKINNTDYILANYILENAPIYSKGIRSGKDLIRKKDFKDFIFGRFTDNKWIQTDGKSAKFDKVLINQSLIEKIDELQGKTTTDDNGIEQAPEIIQLENHEKFRTDNNIIEIETRGERNVDKIYFKVKDVANGFGMEHLYKTIIDERINYQNNIDYKYFLCKVFVNNEIKTHKNTNSKSTVKKELFLTYQGILRVLFISRNNKTDKFIKYSTEKLFTIQMGETESKDELASSLLGVNSKTIKDVFRTNTAKTPSVYLYLIGNAKEIIDNKYDENDIVCKFGCTDDLPRRCNEHEKYFKKEFNKKIELIMFSIIENKYIFEAESSIKQFFKSNKLDYKDSKELIILNKNNLNQVKQHYKMIQSSYIGQFAEMTDKIHQLEMQIYEYKNKYEKQQVFHQLELEKSKHQLELEKNNSNLQKEISNNELLKKELEIMKLQMQLSKK